MTKINSPKRYSELDSLRGVAALSVVLFHFASRLKIYEVENNLGGDFYEKLICVFKYTPLRIICSGHEAIILFFVLSGFVLSLPFYKEGTCTNYILFMIKRVCRIYIPYFVVIVSAIFLKKIFYSCQISELSSIHHFLLLVRLLLSTEDS